VSAPPQAAAHSAGDGRSSDRPALLEASGVTVRYPGVLALSDVGLAVRAGEVRALLGENGAGKSTLIKVIGGLERPSAGSVRVDGREVRLHTSNQAQAAGISVVSQEFRLVPQLTVAKNIFLGHELRRGGLVDGRSQRARSADLLEQLDIDISPTRRIDSLTVGDQQLVEITRALSRDFAILVLDEPTAALNELEVDKLLTLVERLRDDGKAVLYVSHRMPEIMRLAGTATVLRDGEVVGNVRLDEVDEGRLVELMLGRRLETAEVPPATAPASTGEAVLSVRGIRTPGLAAPVSFDVAAGEVVGVAGLVGSGRTELLQAVFGAQRVTGGEVWVHARGVDTSSPAGAIAAGVFMLSEDRKAKGILPHLTVLENLVLSEPPKPVTDPRRWLLDRRGERGTFGRMKEDLHIKVDRPDRPIGTLSGGNQQKVLFGRAVLTDCSVLLLNEPTRGVDVGAKTEIYDLIRSMAARGVAVVVSSSEAGELATLCSRCMVLYAGRVAATLTGDEVTEDAVVTAALGQRGQDAA